MTTTTTINLKGWTLVHTWHESHGDHYTDTYQEERRDYFAKPKNLWVSHYRDGRPDNVTLLAGPEAKDYLLAKVVEAALEAGTATEISETISPCCTAGYRKVRFNSGVIYQISSVAGHGSWAEEVDA